MERVERLAELLASPSFAEEARKRKLDALLMTLSEVHKQNSDPGKDKTTDRRDE